MALSLPDDDKLRKLYFADFVSTLTDAKIILMTSEDLRELLNEFIKPKTIKNEQETNA
jgi:hypothetical protein